jgi:alcohol dehydrogenase YqhD (iron-dependent ADH family)
VRQAGENEVHPEYRAKQNLDVALNRFSTDENKEKESIERAIEAVNDLYSELEERDVRQEDIYEIDKEKDSREIVVEEMREKSSRSGKQR